MVGEPGELSCHDKVVEDDNTSVGRNWRLKRCEERGEEFEDTTQIKAGLEEVLGDLTTDPDCQANLDVDPRDTRITRS